MKRILLLIGFVLSLFTSAQAADIEARTGVMGGDVWGLLQGPILISLNRSYFRFKQDFYCIRLINGLVKNRICGILM